MVINIKKILLHTHWPKKRGSNIITCDGCKFKRDRLFKCCLLPSTKLLRGRTTCCGQQATCCPQHVARPRNLLPRNMLRWFKRGLSLYLDKCCGNVYRQATANMFVPKCRKGFFKFWWDKELNILKDAAIESDKI